MIIRMPHASRSGFATLFVLALLLIIGSLMIANSRTLAHLGQEIHFIEEKQMKAWEHQTTDNGPPPS